MEQLKDGNGQQLRVHVTLRGSLSDRVAGGKCDLDLDEDATIGDVTERLNLPRQHCVVVVNGTAERIDAKLADGDRVVVFPPVSGGSPWTFVVSEASSM